VGRHPACSKISLADGQKCKKAVVAIGAVEVSASITAMTPIDTNASSLRLLCPADAGSALRTVVPGYVGLTPGGDSYG